MMTMATTASTEKLVRILCPNCGKTFCKMSPQAGVYEFWCRAKTCKRFYLMATAVDEAPTIIATRAPQPANGS